ncbi:hypothetical protein CLOM_g24519 [Closterium sp. NIES-68]|nr:hypothetical protein CLOM_g24519 [Closterium sp. NIES-68]GJP75521.1 hypothetical protein CLOP_g5957 [Closterium sp. NIES-67]GJP84958.1 hypothetical protein CLOP_g15002 [Closterium sp. NIES-67]
MLALPWLAAAVLCAGAALVAAGAASAPRSDPESPPVDPSSSPPTSPLTSPPTSPPTPPPTSPSTSPSTSPLTSLSTFPPKSLFASLAAALPHSLSGIAFTHGWPVVKGKVFVCYVAKLRPTRSNGKVVGDRGATGKAWVKGVKAVDGSFLVMKVRVDNIRSGGSLPQVRVHSSCLEGMYDKEYGNSDPYQRIAGNRGHLVNRYSFIAGTKFGPATMAQTQQGIQYYVSLLGNDLFVASHQNNNFSLCGKLRKKR